MTFAGDSPRSTAGSEHFPRDRTFDLHHVRLALSFDQRRGRLRGTASLTLAPLHDGLSEVTLDAVDLEIARVSLAGRPVPFTVADGALVVDLGRPRPAGRPFTVDIAYAAAPRKGLYFIRPDRRHPRKPRQIWSQGEMEDNRYWFPCYDAPDDKCTSETILTVDGRQTALSNGRLVRVTRDRRRGTATYHWRQDVPHATYLISIAVGEFDIREERWGRVPLSYCVPKGRGGEIRSTFGRTRDIMAFFSRVTGVPYPYDKYSQVVVHDFTFGGMENTSLTILTDRCLVPRRLLADTDSDGLIAHELAHQWWGDLVTTKSWTHLWLNEGFASYFDPLYTEHAKGTDAFHLRLKEEAEAYFKEDKVYRRPIVTHRWVIAEDMFDRHTYCKGAWVLHMLRWTVGDDLFWKGIRHYVAKHARRNVETTDLKIAFEEATGRSLDAFFLQWLHRGGHPDFEVSSAWDAGRSLLRLTVKQVQKTDDLTPLFRTPIEVVVSTDRGDRSFRIDVSRAEETFALPLAERPRAVYFDPHGWVLKTVSFKRGVDALLHQLARGPSALCRAEAAEALGKEARSPKVVAGLAAALAEDPFYGTRQAAAAALAAVAGGEAAAALARGLRDKNPKVRRAVAAAMGKMKGDLVARPLGAALRRDRSDLVRAAAVSALGKARAKGAYAAIAAATRRASWNDVERGAALAALGDLGEARGVDLCRKYAAPGWPLAARTGAVESLARLAQRHPDQREEIAAFLVDLLDDPEYHLRRRVAEVCGEIDLPIVREALARARAADVQFGVRRAARLSLEKLDRARGVPEEVSALRAQVNDLMETTQALRAEVEALRIRETPSRRRSP